MLTKHLITVIAALLIIAGVAAASPQLIDYQGFLKNSSGNPFTGTVNITFSIYSASTGGTSKWSETQNNVSVTGGLFNVTLGTVTAIPDTVFNQNDRWLAISIGGSEMSPRARVSSSAYSMRVNTIDGASGGTIAGDLNAGKGNFGAGNSNAGQYAYVAGRNNTASGDSSVVAGGGGNSASSSSAAVAGGQGNIASNGYAFVGGGRGNKARGAYAAVCGGGGASAQDSNVASGSYSFVGGGRSNLATGSFATVVGGKDGVAGNDNATVGGGSQNVASGLYATVSGGGGDTASASNSSVGGGHANLASGYAATIPGGESNKASGSAALAAGNRAKALHDGAFVWSDSYAADFSSSTTNQFNVRSTGGVRIYTNSGLTAGVTLASGASAWQSVSDSTLKQNIRVVDGKDILSRLMHLPVKQWSYKAQSPDIEHIGPMAQDFYALFGLGDDDKTISTIDPAGIALAAIQELYRSQQKLEQKTAEIDDLRAQLAQLKTSVNELLAKNDGKSGKGDLASTNTTVAPTVLNNR